jgi:hypothetical protein
MSSRPSISDVHCFDMGGAVELMEYLVEADYSYAGSGLPRSMVSNRPLASIGGEHFFLPAPRTWLEWDQQHRRQGSHLRQGR